MCLEGKVRVFPHGRFSFLSKVDVHLLRAGDRSANSKDEDKWEGRKEKPLWKQQYELANEQ